MSTIRDTIIDMMIEVEFDCIGGDPDLIKDILLNGCSGYKTCTDEELIACAYTYLTYEGETEVTTMLQEWESQIAMTKIIDRS